MQSVTTTYTAPTKAISLTVFLNSLDGKSTAINISGESIQDLAKQIKEKGRALLGTSGEPNLVCSNVLLKTDDEFAEHIKQGSKVIVYANRDRVDLDGLYPKLPSQAPDSQIIQHFTNLACVHKDSDTIAQENVSFYLQVCQQLHQSSPAYLMTCFCTFAQLLQPQRDRLAQTIQAMRPQVRLLGKAT
jgi:hypothetical protein